MVFGLSSGEPCDAPAIICHRRKLITKSEVWKPQRKIRNSSTCFRQNAARSSDGRALTPGRLRFLTFLHPGAGLFRHVAGAVERALHEIVFGSLTSRGRRQWRGRSLRRNRFGCGRWRFVLLLAQIDKHHAGDKDKDQETTHSFFRSSWRAISIADFGYRIALRPRAQGRVAQSRVAEREDGQFVIRELVDRQGIRNWKPSAK